MAIFQSDWAKGVKTTANGDKAGEVIATRFSYTIPTGMNLAVNDIIELGMLPAGCAIVDATLFVDEAGTATYDVGVMSGDFGDTNQARTSGQELFAGAADATFNRLSRVQALRLAATDKDRSIGLKVLTAGITGAGQVATLVLEYAANNT